MAFWTKHRELELIKLWGEGLSGSVIAAKLGAESRNQVIGKAFRMKLAARRTTQTRRYKKKRVVQPAPVVESRKYRPSQTLVAEPPIPPQDYDVARIATADLEPHHCKWPVGDPGTPGFGHCGCKRAEGLPYCAQHVRRATASPSQQAFQEGVRTLRQSKFTGGLMARSRSPAGMLEDA